MVAVAMVTGGLLLLCMIVAAGYAIRVLPASARVPLNAGVPEYSAWLSRWAGLGAWLGIGVALYAIFAVLTVSSGISGNWMPAVRGVLLPCVMLVVLAAETGAVITARQRAVTDAGRS
ncbi:MAG TPA: hypothetical protein VK817_25015 [Trebonia sp.]|nr:hypothetical protein [Trebonia sp.]